MSDAYTPPLPRSSTGAARRALPVVAASIAVLLALLTLYAVFLDQGALLTPLLGKASMTGNYLHEFAHDGRHLLSGPCH